MDLNSGLSVVIPVAKGDQTWQKLLPDLVLLDSDDEIIFVSPEDQKLVLESEIRRLGITYSCRWLISPAGRATQLNLGAKFSVKQNIWFLHSDSRVTNFALKILKKKIKKNPDSILFFNLKFLTGGPRWILINEIGAWIRSRLLRLPFGDQGFCMSRHTFNKLNGFAESSSYGEDHLLIWKAHQTRVPVKCIGENLVTSARKYSEQGWAHTTIRHITLTIRQAVPELLRLIKVWSSK